MMRLIILNQFFYPDHSATSQLMTVLADDLTQKGVEVTAMASRGSYNGGATYNSSENYQKVKIVRIWATSFGKHKLWRRLTDYITFYLGAVWALLRVPKHDVIMALTTPPLIGLVALLIARLRNMRFVSLQEDLYPDVGIALGFISAKGIVPVLLEKLNRMIIQHADRVIVLSDCMHDHILAKFEPETAAQISAHTDIIHNWADGSEIIPIEPARNTKHTFFAERGLSALADKFIVLFTGNLGLVNDFSAVLTAAEALQNETKLAFVFIGAGAREHEIRSAIETKELKNIYMLPYQAREQMPFALGAADALLITLGDGLAGMSVPSKTYTSLAAGRPLLYVGDPRSSVVQIIEENKCGFACGADETGELITTLRSWMKDPQSLQSAGLRARSLFEKYYDRSIAVAAYYASFKRCLATPAIHSLRAEPAEQLLTQPALPIAKLPVKKRRKSITPVVDGPTTPDTSLADGLNETA